MNLSPQLEETLRWVGYQMRDALDDWWVIASAAAALHRVNQPKVGDVDVLASDRDAAAILERLGVARLAPPPHPLFRSRVLGRWTSTPMVVEFMAGLQVQAETDWQGVLPKTREQFEMGRVQLFAPSRFELAEILLTIGRPKDLERARLLTQ